MDQNGIELRNALESFRPQLIKVATKIYEYAAEDCVQDALIEAHKKFDDFRGNTANQLFCWVRKILMNECLQQIRTKSARVTNESREIDVADPQFETPSVAFRREEELSRLANALDSLTERERDAVTYRYLLEMKIRDTAAIMGTTEQAVNGLVKRAFVKLRGNLPIADFSVLLR